MSDEALAPELVADYVELARALQRLFLDILADEKRAPARAPTEQACIHKACGNMAMGVVAMLATSMMSVMDGDAAVSMIGQALRAYQQERRRKPWPDVWLDEKQRTALAAWDAAHLAARHHGTEPSAAIGGRLSYHVTPTSLGVVLKAVCGACHAEVDLTDYDLW